MRRSRGTNGSWDYAISGDKEVPIILTDQHRNLSRTGKRCNAGEPEHDRTVSGSSPYQTGKIFLLTVELRDFFKCIIQFGLRKWEKMVKQS